MEEKILTTLKQLETKHAIKILYACELGSRAWGYHNQNSDYDVRFLYIHRPRWYLSIDPQKDFIQLPISEKLDVAGWDLQKCLKSYRKSNPTILEFIHSNVSYYQASSIIEKLRDRTQDIFSAKACLYHYLHMAEKNNRKESTGNMVKNYLNILRPILIASWIEKFNTFPEVDLAKLVDEMISSTELKNSINLVIAKKVNGDERNIDVKMIDPFVEDELKRLFEYVETIHVKIEDPTLQLNKIFLNTLTEVWGSEIF